MHPTASLFHNTGVKDTCVESGIHFCGCFGKRFECKMFGILDRIESINAADGIIANSTKPCFREKPGLLP